ncbi:MAG: InlB B-repeat-containing protein [Christensenellales bacterium]
MIKKISNLLLVFCLGFICLPLMFTGCAERAESLSSSVAIQKFKNIDLASSINYVANVCFENSKSENFTLTHYIDENDEIIKVELQSGDIVQLYKQGENFSFIIDCKMYALNSIEFEQIRSKILAYVYDFYDVIMCDEYTQVRILDYFGFNQSINLIGGNRSGNTENVYASCPTIIDDVLYYIESSVKVEDEKVQSIKVLKSAELVYISEALRKNVREYSERKSVTFMYDDIEKPIIESGEQQTITDFFIEYNCGKMSIDNKDKFEVTGNISESGLILQGVDESDVYDFAGWYYDEKCTQFAGNVGDVIECPKYKKLKLFAKCEAKQDALKLTVDYGDAICINEDESVLYFKSGESLSSLVETIDASNYYKLDCYFDNFYKDKNCTQMIDDAILTESTTIYSKFLANKKIIVDDTNINQAFRKYYTDKTVLYNYLTLPTSENMIFVDWYVDKDFSKSLSEMTDDEIKGKSSIKVYAKFEKGNQVSVEVLDDTINASVVPSYIVVSNVQNLIDICNNMQAFDNLNKCNFYTDKDMTKNVKDATELPKTIYLSK